MSKLACSFVAVYLTATLVFAADKTPPAKGNQTVLATVANEPITEADLRLYSIIANLPISDDAEKAEETRSLLLEQIIERRLIRRFLKQQKIESDPMQLATSLDHMKDLIRRRKDDPEALLKRLGLTESVLADQLGLPLAWEAYLRLTISDKQMKDHFQKHRAELDGTKLRASQIILKLPAGAKEQDINERKAKLDEVRKDIVSKKLTFADAAKKYSESPSKEQGGDVGWFPFRGKLPIPLSDAAFALKAGDVSEPIVTPFGVHVIQVTDRQAGTLTVDDVRNEIIDRISQELWQKAVATERERSKVVIK